MKKFFSLKWFLPKSSVHFSAVASSAYTKAENKSVSTQRNYRTAVRSFKKYLDGKDILIEKLTPKLIEGFANWLKENNICDNTIACYMKKLRAILNEYFEGKKEFGYLFKGVTTKMRPTKKRAAKEEDIQKLMSAKSYADNYKEELAIDIAKFQFLAMGMPFVDIANLKVKDIKDGYFDYYRHKTHVKVHVNINNVLRQIIDKYISKAKGEYLFPIIQDRNDFSNQAHLTLVRYNYQLRKICKKLDIQTVTSYVIRHSWASYAYQNDTKLSVISKALGHTRTSTTLTYIQGPGDDKVQEANDMVLSRFWDYYV